MNANDFPEMLLSVDTMQMNLIMLRVGNGIFRNGNVDYITGSIRHLCVRKLIFNSKLEL